VFARSADFRASTVCWYDSDALSATFRTRGLLVRARPGPGTGGGDPDLNGETTRLHDRRPPALGDLDAISTREPHGVWGGLSERERERIWRGLDHSPYAS